MAELPDQRCGRVTLNYGAVVAGSSGMVGAQGCVYVAALCSEVGIYCCSSEVRLENALPDVPQWTQSLEGLLGFSS